MQKEMFKKFVTKTIIATALTATVIYGGVKVKYEVNNMISENLQQSYNIGLQEGKVEGYRVGYKHGLSENKEEEDKKLQIKISEDVKIEKGKERVRDIKQKEKISRKIKIPAEVKSSKMVTVISSYIVRCNPRINPSVAKNLAKYILIAGKTFNIHPYMVTAIIRKESTFKSTSTSNAGAIGLMQVMWSVHRSNIKRAFGDIETVDHMYEPYNNIMVGTWMYSWYLKNNGGSHYKALQRYLGGSSSSYPNTVLQYYNELLSIS